MEDINIMQAEEEGRGLFVQLEKEERGMHAPFFLHC